MITALQVFALFEVISSTFKPAWLALGHRDAASLCGSAHVGLKAGAERLISFGGGAFEKERGILVDTPMILQQTNDRLVICD